MNGFDSMLCRWECVKSRGRTKHEWMNACLMLKRLNAAAQRLHQLHNCIQMERARRERARKSRPLTNYISFSLQLLFKAGCKCFLSHNWFVVRCVYVTLWTTFGFLCAMQFVLFFLSSLFFSLCIGRASKSEVLTLCKLITTKSRYEFIDKSFVQLLFVSLLPLFGS